MLGKKTKYYYINQAAGSRGQTLVEVLIAIGVAVIVVSSMTIAVTTALSNAAYSKDQSLAAQYAQEGMELVTSEKNADFQTFSNLFGRYCMANCSSNISTCFQNPHASDSDCAPNINNKLFIRQIDILRVGSPSLKLKCVSSIQATVSVLWTDGKCNAGAYCHTVSLVSCFSDANVIQGP